MDAPSWSRSRFAEAVFGASSAVWSEEVRALLERRLKVIVITTDALFGAFLINLFVVSRTGAPGVQAAIFAATALSLAAATTALFVQRSPSLRQLRGIEALGLGAMLVVWSVWTYGWLTHGVAVGAWAAPAAADAALKEQAWVLSSDASGTVLHVRSGVPLLGVRMALNWGLVAVAYGTIVPNTWRRAAAVMACMVALPLGTVVVAGVVNPALRPMLPALLFGGTYVLLGFAGLGLYGCHKLDVARRAEFDARHVGQYRLVREIGHGGMGHVYLAEHRHLRRPCAVKLIREQGTTQGRLARFEREVQATARLTHPNTIEVYDFGRTDAGTFFYAMEYLPGMTLEELVERHGPLPAGRVVYLLRQVCGALAEAHALGLIHRDVKPANLFVCDRGGLRDFVKILDFGIVQERTVGALPPAPPAASPATSPAPTVEATDDSRLTREGAILKSASVILERESRSLICSAPRRAVARRRRRDVLVGAAPPSSLRFATRRASPASPCGESCSARQKSGDRVSPAPSRSEGVRRRRCGGGLRRIATEGERQLPTRTLLRRRRAAGTTRDGAKSRFVSRAPQFDRGSRTVILGTPAYVSPEQVQGEDVDARCDVYALGAVAFFLLTASPPFTGKTLLDVCMAHLWTAPPRPSQRVADLPADLDAVVLRCLAKLPGERFQSVRELDAALAVCEAAGSWDGERAAAWWAEHGDLAASAPESFTRSTGTTAVAS